MPRVSPSFTAEHLSEEALLRAQERIYDARKQGVLVTDIRGRIKYANRAAIRLSGGRLRVGILLSDVGSFCDENGVCLPEGHSPISEAIKTGKVVQRTSHVLVQKNILIVEMTSSPIVAKGRVDGVVTYFQDVTASSALARSLERMNRAFQAISECNKILIHAKTERELMQKICRLLIAGGYHLTWIGMNRQDEDIGIEPVTWAGHDASYMKAMRDESGGIVERKVFRDVMASRRPLVMRAFGRGAQRFSQWRPVAHRHGIFSCAVIPIISERQVLGVLSVCSDQRDVFDNRELALLTELANDIGFGIVSLRESVALRKAEKDLIEAQHLAQVGSFSWPAGVDAGVFSSETYKILGQAKKSFHPTYQEALSFVHPDDVYLVKEAEEEAKRGKKHITKRLRIIRKSDGSTRVVICKAQVSFDSDLQSWGIFGTIQDITAREHLEEMLRKHTEQQAELAVRYETLLASIGDGVFAVDAEGRMMYANSAAERLIGKKFSQVSGKQFYEVWDLMDENGFPIRKEDRPLTISIQKNKAFISERYSVMRHDGVKLSVSATITPLRMKGVLIGCIVVVRDRTEESRVERAKDEFISLASHQLRTPLSIIKWYTDALTSGHIGALPEKQQAYVLEVAASNERLIDLVDSLLNISRIEQGRFIADPQLTDVQLSVERCLHNLQAKIAKKHLTFTPDYGRLTTIHFDAKILDIVLQNLLTNAVLYTPPEGEIGVRIRRHKQMMHIDVWDTGIGIPKEDLPHLFEKFYRAGNARSIEPNGTGLGLYIVKTLLASVSGHVSCESDPKNGTTFTVTIPIHLPRSEAPHPRTQKQKQKTSRR